MALNDWLVDTEITSEGEGSLSAFWEPFCRQHMTEGGGPAAVLTVGDITVTISLGCNLDGNVPGDDILLNINVAGNGLAVQDSVTVGHFDLTDPQNPVPVMPSEGYISIGFPCRLMARITEEGWDQDYTKSAVVEGDPPTIESHRTPWDPQRDVIPGGSRENPLPDGSNFVNCQMDWYRGFAADGNGQIRVVCGDADWSYDLGAWSGAPSPIDKRVVGGVTQQTVMGTSGWYSSASRSIGCTVLMAGHPLAVTPKSASADLPTTNPDALAWNASHTPQNQDCIEGSVGPGSASATYTGYYFNNVGYRQFSCGLSSEDSILWDVQAYMESPMGVACPQWWQRAQATLHPFDGPETWVPRVGQNNEIIRDKQYRVMHYIPNVEADANYASFAANYDTAHPLQTSLYRVTGKWTGEVYAELGTGRVYAIDENVDQAGGVRAVGFNFDSLTDAVADFNAWRARMTVQPFWWKALRFTYRASHQVSDWTAGLGAWTLGAGVSSELLADGLRLTGTSPLTISKTFTAAGDGSRAVWFDLVSGLSLRMRAAAGTEVTVTLGGKTWVKTLQTANALEDVLLDLCYPESAETGSAVNGSQTCYQRRYSSGSRATSEGNAWWGVEGRDQTLSISIAATEAVLASLTAVPVEGRQEVQVGPTICADAPYRMLTRTGGALDVHTAALPVLRHWIDGRLESETEAAVLNDDAVTQYEAGLESNYEWYPESLLSISDVVDRLLHGDGETSIDRGRGSVAAGLVLVEDLAPGSGTPVTLTGDGWSLVYYPKAEFLKSCRTADNLAPAYYQATAGAGGTSQIEVWAAIGFDRVQFGPGVSMPLRIRRLSGYGINGIMACGETPADERGVSVAPQAGGPEVDIIAATNNRRITTHKGRYRMPFWHPEAYYRDRDLLVRDPQHPTYHADFGWARTGEIQRICFSTRSGAGNPDFHIDPDTGLGMVAYEDAGAIDVRVTFDAGLTWSSGIGLPDSASAQQTPCVIQMTQDPLRPWHLVWQSGGDVYSGHTWDLFGHYAEAKLLTGYTHPRIVEHPVTGIVLMVAHQTSSGMLRAFRSFDSGKTFDAGYDVASVPAGPVGLSCAPDEHNTWCAVVVLANGNMQTYWSRDNGLTWAAAA